MLLSLLLSAMIAQASTPVHAYHIYITPRFSAFGVGGELKISLTGDGYVIGTYRPESGGEIEGVHGGYKGDSIWFDFGDYHLDGTMKNDAISGVGTPVGPSSRAYRFTATPETTPSP